MQFSIRAMLGFVSAVALLCCVFFAIPSDLAVSILTLVMAFVVPAACVSGCIYARGYSRAFALGAMAPAIMYLLIYVVSQEPSFELFPADGDIAIWLDLLTTDTDGETKLNLGLLMAFTTVSGLTSVAVRWLTQGAAQQMTTANSSLSDGEQAETRAA